MMMSRKARIDALTNGTEEQRKKAEADYIMSTIKRVYEAERKGSEDPTIEYLIKDFEKYANKGNY